VPARLLGYERARLRGHDADKPRNLATSVTVKEVRGGVRLLREGRFSTPGQSNTICHPRSISAGSTASASDAPT
jgi:hypothetical protein